MADRLGVLPHVVEAILNHVSGHRAGVAGVYNRARYAAEMRKALESWAEHVVALPAQKAKAIRLRLGTDRISLQMEAKIARGELTDGDAVSDRYD
jgi:hypothetical protein